MSCLESRSVELSKMNYDIFPLLLDNQTTDLDVDKTSLNNINLLPDDLFRDKIFLWPVDCTILGLLGEKIINARSTCAGAH